MYQFIENYDGLLRINGDGSSTVIPAGHRDWPSDWLAEGNTPIPADADQPVDPPAVDLAGAVVAEASAWLDRRVKERGYDNIVSCISYINSTDELFRNEALAASAWRDALYRALYDMQANPPAGVTTVADAIRLLPQPENYGW